MLIQTENPADVIKSQTAWKRPVFLIGFMGSGKTTVGRTLAKLLDWTFLDTDEMITAEQQMPITQIFAEYGEPYFRDLETGLLRKLERELQEAAQLKCSSEAAGEHPPEEPAEQSPEAAEEYPSEEPVEQSPKAAGEHPSKEVREHPSEGYVISVGGGLPMREENRAIMKRIGTVIYLKASPDTLINRLKGDTSRPLLQGGNLREKILSLMEKRDGYYTQASQIQLFTDEMSVRETARSAARQIHAEIRAEGNKPPADAAPEDAAPADAALVDTSPAEAASAEAPSE